MNKTQLEELCRLVQKHPEMDVRALHLYVTGHTVDDDGKLIVVPTDATDELKVGDLIGFWKLEKRDGKRKWYCRCLGCDIVHLVSDNNLKRGLTKQCKACYDGQLRVAGRSAPFHEDDVLLEVEDFFADPEHVERRSKPLSHDPC